GLLSARIPRPARPAVHIHVQLKLPPTPVAAKNKEVETHHRHSGPEFLDRRRSLDDLKRPLRDITPQPFSQLKKRGKITYTMASNQPDAFQTHVLKRLCPEMWGGRPRPRRTSRYGFRCARTQLYPLTIHSMLIYPPWIQ